ncbi:MAG: ATP-dependent zinc protease, partial [Magnetococcales bacterium]|nr:ATP-dependent zinc protease [Magnetococcales bacterium]
MPFAWRAFCWSFWIILAPLPAMGQEMRPPLLIGHREWAVVETGLLRLQAKIDTGAATSSLDIDAQEWSRKDGVSRVRFRVTPERGRQVVLERPVVRLARIRRAGLSPDSRPVVMLHICLGDRTLETEVNLTDRGNMTHPLLLGRHFLKKG